MCLLHSLKVIHVPLSYVSSQWYIHYPLGQTGLPSPSFCVEFCFSLFLSGVAVMNLFQFFEMPCPSLVCILPTLSSACSMFLCPLHSSFGSQLKCNFLSGELASLPRLSQAPLALLQAITVLCIVPRVGSIYSLL